MCFSSAAGGTCAHGAPDQLFFPVLFTCLQLNCYFSTFLWCSARWSTHGRYSTTNGEWWKSISWAPSVIKWNSCKALKSQVPQHCLWVSVQFCTIPWTLCAFAFSPVHLNGLGPMISEDQPKINLLEFIESFHCHSATYLQSHIYIQQRWYCIRCHIAQYLLCFQV